MVHYHLEKVFWEYNPLTDNWSQLPSHLKNDFREILLSDVMSIFY